MTHRVEPSGAGDFDGILGLWNACAGERFPLTERALAQTLEGASRTTQAASLVVRDGPRIAGWALARAHTGQLKALEPSRGRGGLAALCVAPSHRRRGIGRALVAAAEAHLRAFSVARCETVVAPYHLVPGVPAEASDTLAFLAALGFGEVGRCLDMDGDVSAYEVPASVDAKQRADTPEVVIRAIEPAEREALIAFVAREFPGTWHYLAQRHASIGRPDDVVVAAERGALIGFCMVHDERSPRLAGSTMWFPALGEAWGGLGPIGVGSAQRGRGLGLALLCRALEHQRRRGVRHMVIDWTTLEDFYAKAGFRAWRRYVQLARPL